MAHVRNLFLNTQALIAVGAAALALLTGASSPTWAQIRKTPGKPAKASAKSAPPAASQSARIVVVENTDSPDSVAIGDYYIRRRHVPPANVCRIACPTDEEIPRAVYEARIETPVRQFLSRKNGRIDYLLLTKGLPIRVPEGGYSVDSLLGAMDLPKKGERLENPYFGKAEPFSHARYGFYLVSRLIGYTRADCLRLVDSALAARRPLASATILIHTGPGHTEEGYHEVNDAMRRAHDILARKGVPHVFSAADKFPGEYKNLVGYYSWGSNDNHFDRKAYNTLGFVPGAIADTVVSTSGRTFANPNAPGQSLIADLIAQGVTGCKGYVSEPFADAIARPEILFDRYTSGANLIDSFYMASQFLYWKDMVIGDPLCAPYAKK